MAAVFDASNDDWALSVAAQENEHLSVSGGSTATSATAKVKSPPPPSLSPIVGRASLNDESSFQMRKVQNSLYDSLVSASSADAPPAVDPDSYATPVSPTTVVIGATRTLSTSSSSSSSTSVTNASHPVQALLEYVRVNHLPYPSFHYDVSRPQCGVTVRASCGSIQFESLKTSKKVAKADAAQRLLDCLRNLSSKELDDVREKSLQDAAATSGFGIASASGNPVPSSSSGVADATAVPSTNDGDDDDGLVKAEDISLINKHLNTVLMECSSDTVQIQRRDPNSPLYSCTTFEQLDLPHDLLKGVYSMGYNQPSKIQETALPLLLGNPPQNLIAQSQSGTGKTAAFVIAMLKKIDPSKKHPQALVLSPTYELAQQTGKVIEEMAKFCTGVSCIFSVRGNVQPRGTKLTQQIVIGTPGTTLDWALKLKFFDPKLIKVFVLDEADVMIDTQGHQDQSIRIHRLLNKDNTLHMLFSATYTPEVISFAERVVPNAAVIRLLREQQSVENIKAFYITCHAIEDKFEALVNIYGTITVGQAIIFCKTRKDANWLASKLRKEGHLVGLLSGELEIQQRAEVINRFRRGNEKILISTNVSARGIDVAQVTVVVNFDLPTVDKTNEPDYDTYLHRIGRTGRFGKKGIAITMVGDSRDIINIKKIEQHFGRPIEPLNAEDIDELRN